MSSLKNLYFHKAMGYKFIDEISLKNSSFFMDLDSLNRCVKSCELCSLSKSRKTPLILSSKSADIMVIFKSPNETQNLKADIKACKNTLKFCNTLYEIFKNYKISYSFLLKCYGNYDEISVSMCKDYLFEEIEKLSPKLILTMGELVSRVVLKSSVSFDSLKGSLFKYKYSLIMPLDSLDYILKNPSKKDEFIESIKRAKEFIKTP
ncbi:uracil-DNA glycosylase family protein [Campylobacter corcagiensis]|uniref:Uracil-DNA glycosylase n=1 Tax=Campylobacter corcagiensis TaxID=1448857 RepID=A0A7M1LDV9_9BACT|nr:uracil-DNA glycosylase family protein [Campylobacter corcagiensis]QKF65098.1 uracil-DNA glycosylase, family 4 [Campylobacter corcagiensis]QOQ86757.1 hypothetical protein IMC76_05915 [Campylobacter corcagiensis]